MTLPHHRGSPGCVRTFQPGADSVPWELRQSVHTWSDFILGTSWVSFSGILMEVRFAKHLPVLGAGIRQAVGCTQGQWRRRIQVLFMILTPSYGNARLAGVLQGGRDGVTGDRPSELSGKYHRELARGPWAAMCSCPVCCLCSASANAATLLLFCVPCPSTCCSLYLCLLPPVCTYSAFTENHLCIRRDSETRGTMTRPYPQWLPLAETCTVA